jgi:HEPN domain-containing protein
MTAEIAELARHWIRRADHHLVAAAVLVESNETGTEDAACYHAHEAVAICLKALHTISGIAAPRTHDLEFLNRLLPERRRLRVDSGELACLSTFGIERWWEPDAEQARRAVAFATAIRDEAWEILRTSGMATEAA